MPYMPSACINWYRAAETGIAMYSIVYACIDRYKDVKCHIGLYRLV